MATSDIFEKRNAVKRRKFKHRNAIVSFILPRAQASGEQISLKSSKQRTKFKCQENQPNFKGQRNK